MNDLQTVWATSSNHRTSATGAPHVLTRNTHPRLLVSVRSCDEAAAALQGGTDILDIKEPSRGSLGMADIETIRAIAEMTSRTRPTVPVSAALGEVPDWFGREDVPRLPPELTFAKVGLSGLREAADWRDRWLQIRDQLGKRCQRRIQWVAVAYADERNAQSPGIDEILAAAMATRCAGLLIDTFAKAGRSLLDYLNAERLRGLADRCHASGLFFALAGSLSEKSLSELSTIQADVIAIRTAACEHANRNGHVSAEQVAAFCSLLRRQESNRASAQTPDS